VWPGARAPSPLLDETLCTAAAVGPALVVLWPGARGISAAGVLPMWLVGMPMLAWWALHGFALPARRPMAVAVEGTGRPGNRRGPAQARRPRRAARRSEARRAA